MPCLSRTCEAWRKSPRAEAVTDWPRSSATLGFLSGFQANTGSNNSLSVSRVHRITNSPGYMNSFDIGDAAILQSKKSCTGRTVYMRKILWASLLLTMVLLAQSERANLTGFVIDPSGAPIASASVTVIHLDTNTTAMVKTTPGGDYNVSNLSPGRYRVE